MYKARSLWEDAICVAQKFLPTRLSEIQYDFASFVKRKSGGVETLESVLAKGKAAESSQNFQEAIDLYLQLDLKSLPDMENLQKVWRKALDLAKEHAKSRLSEVIHAVAEQLVKAGQYQEAAQLYLEYDDHKEAADVYIMGGYWDEARKVAESFGQQQLFQHIESLYKEHLLKTGEAGLLVNIGSIEEALEIYFQKEDWDKVHELSAMMGPEVQKDFSVRHAAHCLKNAKVLEAVSVISRYGLPHTLEVSELCRCITSQLLYSCSDTPVSVLAMQELKTLLYNHVQDIKGSNLSDSQPALKDLEALLLPVTYMVLRFSCQRQGLKELAAKLSISLLRFIQSLPADKAFYEAGFACKEVDWKDKAFVYLNQYLDIAEAIDDGETNITIDHPTFNKSDIPQTFTIPKRHFVDVDKQEEVQDWAIQFSVNQQVEKSSITRDCKVCQNSIYEASLYCFNCKTQSKACCVTGYPVDKDAQVECQVCHMLANICDWTTFVQAFHSCPWCNTSV